MFEMHLTCVQATRGHHYYYCRCCLLIDILSYLIYVKLKPRRWIFRTGASCNNLLLFMQFYWVVTVFFTCTRNGFFIGRWRKIVPVVNCLYFIDVTG
jgi:hypothetical protein